MKRAFRRQAEQRRRALNAELAACDQAGRPVAFTIHVMPTFEAVRWPGFATGVYAYLSSIDPKRPDASACFVCDKPWTPYRVPASMLLLEFVEGPSGHKGAIQGICEGCANDGERIVAATRRRFPNCTATPMSVHGTAQ